MEIKIEIKKRNRDYGILTWPYQLDFEIKTLFELKEICNFEFDGQELLSRKVSYKFRRIAIGKKRIADSGNKRFFVLSKVKDKIEIKTE